MDNTNNINTNVEKKLGKKKGKSSRKWREIEAIKDRYQLQKELYELDMFDLNANTKLTDAL